jgi:biotin carboxylase
MTATTQKSILLLGAGLEQTLAIREAKQLGLKIIACDKNPQAPGLSEAAISLVYDIRDVQRSIAVGREYGVSGVFCHAVEIPEVTAAVAEGLGTPGLSPVVAARATNKLARLKWLKKNAIPTARFQEVKSAEELEQKALRLGLPLIIKPTDNAGARGVKLVETEKDLGQAYREATNYSRSTAVVLERQLKGPEISTESVVYRNQVYTFAFADRNYSGSEEFHPYFVEDGINFPSILTQEAKEEVLALVERTIRALAIDFGAAKGDIIIANGRPMILEMACRTSGGWFGAGSIPAATGINMLKPLLQMAVAEEPDLDCLTPTRHLFCAQRYLIPRQRSIVLASGNQKEIQQMPGVKMASIFLPDAGTIIDKATNHAQRYAQVICTGASMEEAIERCNRAIARIAENLQPAEE